MDLNMQDAKNWSISYFIDNFLDLADFRQHLTRKATRAAKNLVSSQMMKLGYENMPPFTSMITSFP